MSKRNRLALPFLAVLAISIIASCNKPNSTLASENDSQYNTELSDDTLETVYPKRAINKHKEWIGDEDTLSLSIGNYDFTIYPGPILKWGDKDSVRLSDNVYVAKAYFYTIENDLLLFCEMSDGDEGYCDLFRINLSNGLMKWNVYMDGFNLGQPVIRANSVYITAIGAVAKLDFETGKFMYEESNLYDSKTTSFNSFDKVLFKGNTTYFVSKRPLNNIVDTVIIDENTNKMTIKQI